MTGIAKDFKKVRFWKKFLVHGFSALGVFAVALELAGWVLGGAFDPKGWPLFTIISIFSAAYGLYKAWPRPISYQLSAPNTLIRIIEDDLFSMDSDLVIGMTDTFDTSTPNIIAPGSVQAQMTSRLFDGDVSALDGEIALALQGKPKVGTISKHGKTDKYGLGAVATLVSRGKKLYLLAYTEMDSQNVAHATPDGLWRSLETLWSVVSDTGNGRALSMPVIGQGQSRLSPVMPAQDSIRLTLLSFIFASRRRRVCEELTIVVRAGDYDKLDHLELQAFIRSLQPS
ncbi:macro domain-containing protein [Clavibacter michiganensis]|uniref:macro domain-containing protein n=1 Tax=Clavibacter michiganensis TaxID=28447 RepID=UPI0011982038|nr:macro domain-containing protein [Clavibacter michiganensis]